MAGAAFVNDGNQVSNERIVGDNGDHYHIEEVKHNNKEHP